MRRSKSGLLKVCRCECGGQVYGEYGFGLLWTWCDTCTPKVEVKK